MLYNIKPIFSLLIQAYAHKGITKGSDNEVCDITDIEKKKHNLIKRRPFYRLYLNKCLPSHSIAIGTVRTDLCMIKIFTIQSPPLNYCMHATSNIHNLLYAVCWTAEWNLLELKECLTCYQM